MEIRDPVHGSIQIDDVEVPIIEHSFFQRLRNIKQLGLSEYVFPGATHSRFLHSIGVMGLAGTIFDKLFIDLKNHKELPRLRETLRLAALLHDIGHAPLSHATEFVMPQVEALKLPSSLILGDKQRQATHEDYTLKAIVDSSFTKSFENVMSKYGISPTRVAELILGKTSDQAYFEINGVNYFPVLHQLVSSEIDCDRMDYLLRDSYFCGVSYGKYDLPWLLENLCLATIYDTCSLGISERAISTFDDFLLSRFHMFLMVYFHYRAVCLEQMLAKYFQSAVGEYSIPADIEAYSQHDDHYLMNVLKKSQNDWAKRIVGNNIPMKIMETFGNKTDQIMLFEKVEQYLTAHQIDYIKCSSRGRLSKYYTQGTPDKNFPIWVVGTGSSLRQGTSFTSIQEATGLYERYSETHAVNRLHCDFNALSKKTQDDLIALMDEVKK